MTVCTDLLRPGGYGRSQAYFRELTKRMKGVGVRSIEEFVLHAYGNAAEALSRAGAGEGAHFLPVRCRVGSGRRGSKAQQETQQQADRLRLPGVRWTPEAPCEPWSAARSRPGRHAPAASHAAPPAPDPALLAARG